ncbi:MAG: host-nuclease inhibitor Gam family protein, partial [Kiritimatiellaeota bacterium]|nr:host-nuclease inhibitor Gam family protein [Kiritimatiellota bacterium]
KMLLAQNWAENNPAEFGTRKSIDFVNGQVGFRTGQPKLTRLAGWTWDRILEAVGRVLPDYVRIKKEVDRERIIADREILTPLLRDIGVEVEQDEAFFVDPKREEIGEAPQAA